MQGNAQQIIVLLLAATNSLAQNLKPSKGQVEHGLSSKVLFDPNVVTIFNTRLTRSKRTVPSEAQIIKLFGERPLGADFVLVHSRKNVTPPMPNVVAMKIAAIAPHEHPIANLKGEAEKLNAIWKQSDERLRRFLPKVYRYGQFRSHGMEWVFFAMTMTGPTISSLWDNERISLEELKRVVYEAFFAIVDLHKHGFVHGDLHFGNMALSAHSNAQLMLIDFGGASHDLSHAHWDFCVGLINELLWEGVNRFGPEFFALALGQGNLVDQAGRTAKCIRSTAYKSVVSAKELVEIQEGLARLLGDWLGPNFGQQNAGKPLANWNPSR